MFLVQHRRLNRSGDKGLPCVIEGPILMDRTLASSYRFSIGGTSLGRPSDRKVGQRVIRAIDGLRHSVTNHDIDGDIPQAKDQTFFILSAHLPAPFALRSPISSYLVHAITGAMVLKETPVKRGIGGIRQRSDGIPGYGTSAPPPAEMTGATEPVDDTGGKRR